MSVRALIGLSFACGLTAVATAGHHSAIAEGTQALTEGKKLLNAGRDARPAFLRAWKSFEGIQDDLADSPGRLRNIGNAAYLSGDLSYALLCYRRGLMRDPHDAALRASLDYVRSQVQYPPGPPGRPESDFWPNWLPRFGARVWLMLVAVGYFGGCVAATVWFFRRVTALGCAALVGFAAAALGAYGWQLLDRQWRRDQATPVVVIRTDDVPFRVGNGPSYPAHAELPFLRRGMEARLLGSRGDWWQIQFASGDIGWIPAIVAYAEKSSNHHADP